MIRGKHIMTKRKDIITTRFFVLVTLLLFVIPAFAQQRSKKRDQEDIFDVGKNLPKFITTPDSTVRLHVVQDDKEVEPKLDKTYYWFTLNQLHATKGGFSNRLLDGLYEAFDKNNNILEKGYFISGLKDGQWIRWYANGQMQEVINWDLGYRTGQQLLYDQSGNVLARNTYVSNQLDGKCYLYQDSAIVTQRYKSGKLVKSKSIVIKKTAK